jgi:hypothetical protein
MPRWPILLFIFSISHAFAGTAAFTLTLVDEREPERPFLVKIDENNSQGIKSFESYLRDGIVVRDEDGHPDIGIAIGPVEEVIPSKLHEWSFRIDPKKVEFADLTTEVCDGNFTYVEDHLEEWLTSVKQYCPWSTRRLVKEIRRGKKILFKR